MNPTIYEVLYWRVAFALTAIRRRRLGPFRRQPGTQSRGGKMTAIAILLPVGAGYLFYKSLKRRWRVLKMRPNR
jgi:hypothetical protein